MRAGYEERLVGAHSCEQRLVKRAQVVLLAEQGLGNEQIAPQVGLSADRVSKWRTRFVEEGIEGLCDRPRAGGRPAPPA